MISNLISSLNKKLQAIELSSKSKKTTYIYRDDLSKKKKKPSMEAEIKKVKKRVRFAETEPVIISFEGDDREENYVEKDFEDRKKSVDKDPSFEAEADAEAGKVVRIKLKMTKEEAYRMLSRCSNGGVLEFGDVACELMQIPAARVSTALVVN